MGLHEGIRRWRVVRRGVVLVGVGHWLRSAATSWRATRRASRRRLLSGDDARRRAARALLQGIDVRNRRAFGNDPEFDAAIELALAVRVRTGIAKVAHRDARRINA